MLLRTIADADLEAVLALNQGALDGVGTLDLDRLRWIVEIADQAVVVTEGDDIAGFAITMPAGSAYDSANYVWFQDQYEDFVYLDRVVVAPAHRRRGVATVIYDAVEEASLGHGQLALEVYVEPPNEASLGFHAGRGYLEVGRLGQANGKTCAMYLKPLTG